MTPTPAAPKLLLAPLKGLSDAVFRKTYAEHFSGFDGAVAPFITALPADRLTERHVRDLLPRADGGIPVVPQILANTAENFAFLARHLYDMGYPEVNWNLGCPFRPVTKKKRGAIDANCAHCVCRGRTTRRWARRTSDPAAKYWGRPCPWRAI